jgi:hypothetical protein
MKIRRKMALMTRGSPSGSGHRRPFQPGRLTRGDLVGIVAFGSWARGETADGSDVLDAERDRLPAKLVKPHVLDVAGA